MPQHPAPALQRTFWCFISYRHADNKEPGRQWATWLHQMIETYEVPADLVGTTNDRGDTIPERIYPVFRDEEELPVDADLATPIFRALDASKFLLVICSPRAVASAYVAQEISYFKQLGREDRVLAAMIDGIPNASGDAAKQGLECFPTPLRHRVDAQGNLLPDIAEPVAADFRLDDATQGWCIPEAYRQALKDEGKLSGSQIDQRVASYQQRCELMKLKIIAGVLGIPLGTLTQRDKAYQLELSRKRAKRLRQWLAAVALLGIFAIAGAIVATQQARIAREQSVIAQQQRQRAQEQTVIAQEQTVVANMQRTKAEEQTVIATQNLSLAQRRLAESFYKEGARLIEGPAGPILPAAEALVSSLEADPTYAPARRMLDHQMATREWVVPLAKVSLPEDILQSWYDPVANKLLLLGEKGSLQSYDLKTSTRLRSLSLEKELAGVTIASAACAPGHDRIGLLVRTDARRQVSDENGSYELDWSWKLLVVSTDGKVIGSDPLTALNGDRNFRIEPIRADRLADQPLFFFNDRTLALMEKNGVRYWEVDQGLKMLGTHTVPMLSQWERIHGWEIDYQKSQYHYLTNCRVIDQTFDGGKISYQKAFDSEPQEMFPTPDPFSGMISFGAKGRASISGLVDASFQLPEGVAIGAPRMAFPVEEGWNKPFVPFQGVLQFTAGGGWMHYHDYTFSHAPSMKEDENVSTTYFPNLARITEWPPFLMREGKDSLLMLSTVQSGSLSPQLLEMVRKPKLESETSQSAEHQGLSQVLPGRTCWIADDGSRLAQVQGKEWILYRIGWRATGGKPQPAGTRPYSFHAGLLAGAPAPPLPAWQPVSNPTAVLREGKSFPLPAGIRHTHFVASHTLTAVGKTLMIFQTTKPDKDKDEYDSYDLRFRVWILDHATGTSRVTDAVSSCSVDADNKILATCNGTQVKLEDLSTGTLAQSFSPKRLGNHMIAPAHTVFFSTDAKVLGVGSLVSVQDLSIDYRAFDVDTGREFPFARHGGSIWEFDLFPPLRGDQLQEWKFGKIASASKPFFLSGCDRAMIQALGAQATKQAGDASSPDAQNAPPSIMQWLEFAR